MSPHPSSPPQSSGLYLFVAAYVSLLAIAGVILFGPGWWSPRERNLQEGLRWPVARPALLNCSSLRDISGLELVAGGWTKAVYRGKFGQREVAVKTVNLHGHDVRQCQARGEPTSECYSRAAAKLMREMILLSELAHDNMVQVLGSCVPASTSGGPVAVVTELGEPLDTVRLLQLDWEDRLQLALGVARILQLLARSPLGSLAMNDFRRQQFVVVRGVLKLSDVDDLGVEEPSCEEHADCTRALPPDLRSSGETPPRCEGSRCIGHNERVNVWRAGKHFIKQFLPLGAPVELQPRIAELLTAYSNATWCVDRILTATEELVDVFASGQYLEQKQRRPTAGQHLPVDNALAEFNITEEQDLPGRFDYACAESRSVVTCVRSVHGPEEAAQLCLADSRCQAVVLGTARTWTGRALAVLKSGVGPPSHAPGHRLLIRRPTS